MLKLQEGQFVKITGAEVKNDNDIYIVECDYSIEGKYATCNDEYCLQKVKLNGELSKSKYIIFFYSEYAIKENPNLKIEIITDLKKAKKEVNAYLKSRENNEVVTSYEKSENQTITSEKVFIRFIKPLTFGTWGTKYIRKDSIFYAYLRDDNCLVLYRIGKQGQLLSLLNSSNSYSFSKELTERTIAEHIEIVEKVETKKGDIATEVKSIETIAEIPTIKEESKKFIETIGNMIMHPITKKITKENNYEMFEDWKEVEFVNLNNCKEELTDDKAILSGNMNGENFTIEMSIEDYFEGKSFNMNNEKVNEDNTKIEPFSKETLKYTNDIVNTIIEMNWELLELKMENEYIHGLVKKSNGKTEWEGLYGGNNYDKEYNDTKEVYRCLKGRMVLSNTDDLKEDKELSTLVEVETIEESKEETIQEIKNNNIDVTVNFNTDKNGIELSFKDKPNEDIRQQLKANGFRWAKYNKVWYVKDSEDKREFLKDIGFLTNEGGTITITESDKKDIEYPTIDIDDIENYTIDAKLSKRENDNSMFRRNDTDHQKQLQDILQSANDDITEFLKMDCDKYMEYKAKTYLQSFKKKYYELYKRILNHKVSNPSWAVTGMGNLNVSRYNKKQEQLNNMYKQSSELIDNFNNKIEGFKNKLAREKQQELKKEMDNNLNSIKEISKFKKVKTKINGDATRENIFNINNIRWIREVNAYQLEGYSIINNWGAWRVYNADGKEIYSAKSKGTLKDAQKYVLYIISQKISA